MRRLFLVLGLIFGVSVGHAMKVQDVPNPRVERGSYVQDSAGLLDAGQVAQLDALSVDLEAKTGAELAFVTIDDLDGESVEEFANNLFKRYGVGKKSENNGILILVARDNRRFRVEVGYGLEGVLPDALCKRLMDQLAVPKFKAGQFGAGLYELGYALAQRVAAEKGTSLGVSAGSTEATPSEPLTLVGAAEDSSDSAVSAPPLYRQWWRWGNGALAFVVTLLLIVWRTVRFHLSPSLAGKRLALYRDGNAYPAALAGVGALVTMVWGGIVGGMPFLSMLGGGVLSVGLWKLWRKSYLSQLELYRRPCVHCRQPMEVIQENADDAKLKDVEVDEERAEGMDYEFWRCRACAFEERFDVKLPYASNCPKCGRRSLVTKETIISAATYDSSGKKRIDKNCKVRTCKHEEVIYKTIPRKTRSNSSGGSGGGGGGGSFGGGSSGGGGASGGW